MKGLYQIYTELYHASANKFDEFSTDFILSGIGGNLFGFGIYTAELRKNAKSYIAGGSEHATKACYIDGIKASDVVCNLVRSIVYSGHKRPDKILDVLKHIDLDKYPTISSTDKNIISKAKKLKYNNGTYLYKIELVDIGRKRDFLDWFKPPTPDQISKIQSHLASIGQQQKLNSYNIQQLNGKDVYYALCSITGDDKTASKFLSDAGIDGIVYEAYGQNDYVIFDPKSIKIVKRTDY